MYRAHIYLYFICQLFFVFLFIVINQLINDVVKISLYIYTHNHFLICFSPSLIFHLLLAITAVNFNFYIYYFMYILKLTNKHASRATYQYQNTYGFYLLSRLILHLIIFSFRWFQSFNSFGLCQYGGWYLIGEILFQ